MSLSKEERSWSMRKALASSVISGHVPTPEFLADCEAIVEGRMTHAEARARSLARVLGTDNSPHYPGRRLISPHNPKTTRSPFSICSISPLLRVPS